jgi:pyrroloquinoline quinone biosynthesis protein B
MNNYRLFLIFLLWIPSINSLAQVQPKTDKLTDISLLILGTVQDAGSPHIACTKACCKELFNNPDKNRMVVSIGLLDKINSKTYLFEATPDISMQMKQLKNYANFSKKEAPDAIFLTHAHIGHYTGLMYLGKEAINAKEIKVFAMPKMKTYLENNGPWSQLVNSKNIVLAPMQDQKIIQLSKEIKVIPFLVPHRDEYSETVGYKIIGPNKSALFIPDIDKWQKWNLNIIDEIAKVDYAFLDATFYDGEEINNRDISEIPHPFIIESMQLFQNLNAKEKSKVHFIHLNHTNPALDANSEAYKEIIKKGFHVAKIFDTIAL